MRRLLAALVVLLAAPSPLEAQWTNRYERMEGYGHHVYVEGFDFPTLGAGILDPAPAPDGRTLAVAARGWIWLLDLPTGVAERLSSGPHLDSRPAWSPGGERLAFVRDDTRRTWIVVVDPATGAEVTTVEHGPVAFDPAFSPDGAWLYYASSSAGDLDVWRTNLATGERQRVTELSRLQLRPQPAGEGVVYVHKGTGSLEEVRYRSYRDGSEHVLIAGGILSQTRPSLSPDGRVAAINRPTPEGTWELVLVELSNPAHPVRLATGLPLMPAWSPDGEWIYHVESDPERVFRLRRIRAAGGEAEEVAVREWRWGAPTGRLRIRTRLAGEGSELPARLHVVDAGGHPVLPDRGQVWFDGQNGRVFYYSPGIVEVEAPAGRVEVLAVHGLSTPPVRMAADVPAGGVAEITLDLAHVWDPRRAGWYSGDHHFHLNYGGVHHLQPADLIPMMRGEGLDVATPLLANLHNRFEDQELWGWRRDDLPIARFGQEVRAHFHGHVGLVGNETLFWPWIWGPGNPVYNRDDRSNAEALRHVRAENGIGVYVHPVSIRDPFGVNPGSIPLELITDGVLGDLDAIELACLWTDELGTAEVWYRLLNIGRPILAVAGTDVMKDYYRTMAVGTTRVYARVEGAVTFDRYLEALKQGRSFVSTGPMLEFRIGDAGPGEIVGPGTVTWTLNVHSPVPVEAVELLVNGRVVWESAGLAAPGTRSFQGSLALPDGGWVAARVRGEAEVDWPLMNPLVFAHTGPTWIGRVGSVDPDARRLAATDLLAALDVAEARLETGYASVDVPTVRERFRRARAELEAMAGTR